MPYLHRDYQHLQPHPSPAEQRQAFNQTIWHRSLEFERVRGTSMLGRHGSRNTLRRSDQLGQAALEFAMVLPFIIIVIFMLVEAVIMLKTWSQLEYATREGARYGVVANHSESDIIARVVDRSSGLLGGGTGTVNVTGEQGPSGEPLQVSVTYPYSLRTPLGALMTRFLGGGASDFNMTAQTRMRIE